MELASTYVSKPTEKFFLHHQDLVCSVWFLLWQQSVFLEEKK